MATKKKEVNAVLPPKIKIAGYDVAVRPMTGNEESYSGAGGTYCYGNINVSLDSPSQRVAMCLMHEVLHACFDHSGLRYKYQNFNGHDIEEEIVSTLGFSLAQIIGTEDQFVDFIRNAFKNRPVEVPQECMQIPIVGNWVMGEEMPVQMQKKKVTM